MKVNPAVSGGLKLNTIRRYWERRQKCLGVDPILFLGASQTQRDEETPVLNTYGKRVPDGTDHADWEMFLDAVRAEQQIRLHHRRAA